MPFKAIAQFGKKTYKEKLPPHCPEAVFQVIKKRYSCRDYTGEGVSDAIIKELMEAASYAPSAKNSQPWDFIIIRDEDKKKKIIVACGNQKWMKDAGVFIVACINMRIAGMHYDERGTKLYGIQGVSAAIENMIIYAESLGLGTCWVGSFSEPHVGVLCECPEYVRPCAIITLGWTHGKPERQERHKTEEFVHHEIYGNTALDRRVLKERGKA